MMKVILLLYVFVLHNLNTNGLLHKTNTEITTTDHHVLSTTKIYSNIAEIIEPLGKLPIEFSYEDWSDIHSDSIKLVGANVNVTQQSITAKKKSLNNAQVYVRTPSSSNSQTKFVKATMIDETRNLVKLIDKHISEEPIFFIAQSDYIIYENEPPQTKYYVNFSYDTTDAVYLSYLRRNLNWKTRYQLNLFEESKSATLIALADIRNDGKSRIDIKSAELLSNDFNILTSQSRLEDPRRLTFDGSSHRTQEHEPDLTYKVVNPPIDQGEDLSGLYVFSINQSFSIDTKTNYLITMFHIPVNVERYASISKHFSTPGYIHGKAERAYRLTSDRFLPYGNYIIREFDCLVGETLLPNIGAKQKHEFSIGQHNDIIYKENSILISLPNSNITTEYQKELKIKTPLIYEFNLFLKNFKINRPVKTEYQKHFDGALIKLLTTSANLTLENTTIKYTTIIPANNEKILVYKVEITK
ncbi:unnamed protein product [Rotaria sp. Silwood1]|nr:unnamed protein product [Rotaria sp. Silwood1]CAF4979155.1 unnamed protein product [Rotaria sp. Silwood1]